MIVILLLTWPISETNSVRYIIVHEEFRRDGYFYDIALLKLSRQVEFTEYILPVCLPPVVLERSHMDALVGQMPTVIGYGATSYGMLHLVFTVKTFAYFKIEKLNKINYSKFFFIY